MVPRILRSSEVNGAFESSTSTPFNISGGNALDDSFNHIIGGSNAGVSPYNSSLGNGVTWRLSDQGLTSEAIPFTGIGRGDYAISTCVTTGEVIYPVYSQIGEATRVIRAAIPVTYSDTTISKAVEYDHSNGLVLYEVEIDSSDIGEKELINCDDCATSGGSDSDYDLSVAVGNPGGISDHLQLWLRGDLGKNTTSFGFPVTSWADQSPNGYSANADVNSTDNPVNINNAINFNPGIKFDGEYTDEFSDGLHLGSDYIYSQNDGITIFAAIKVTTSNGGQYDYITHFGGPGNTAYGFAWNNATSRIHDPTSNSFNLHNSGFSTSLLEYEMTFNQVKELKKNGSVLQSASLTSLNELTATQIGESDHYGALGSGDESVGPFSIGRQSASQFADGDRVFEGIISEIIVFDDTLSRSETERVNTYLAVKYGMTLSHNYYSSNGTLIKDVTDGYANNIAGIGADSPGGLSQKQSKSQTNDAIVTIALGALSSSNQSNPNSFAAGDPYLVWGHNGAAENANWDATNFNIPGGNYSGIDRVWKLDETGDIGQIELSVSPNSFEYNLPTIPSVPTSDGSYYVLFDDDGDFTNGGSTAMQLDGSTLKSGTILDASSTYITVGIKVAVEICDNEIDDDGNGLVDELCPFTNCDSLTYIISARNSTQPSYLQTINSVIHPFTSLDTIGTSLSASVNAVGYRVQDNYLYGIRRQSTNLSRISSDAIDTDLGTITGLPSGNYITGDIFSDGYLYVMRGGSNSDVYQVDVTVSPPAVVSVYQLSENLKIADFAYSEVDGKLYTVATDGRKLMIDPTGPVWTVTEIGTPARAQFYGAVYTSQNGRVFIYGNSTGKISQVDFGFNGTGTGTELVVGIVSRVSLNDGASCRGTFITPEICGNGYDDDNDGNVDCVDTDCEEPVITGITPSNPSNCPDLDNGSIVISATGSNLEYSIDGGATYQSSNTFSNLSGGEYDIVIQNVISFCYSFTFSNITLTNLACPEVCDDGIDNDLDGNIDFADTECDLCSYSFSNDKLYISKRGPSSCGDDILQLDWDAGTTTASNEQNLGQNLTNDGWSDIAFSPNGKMYANWTLNGDNMELLTLDPITGQSIDFICEIDGANPYSSQSELVADLDGFLYTVLGDGTTTALYKYKPTDTDLDQLCDELTLVMDLTATGLVGTGDLAWSFGKLFWTAANLSLSNPPAQLVELNIDAGTSTIHPLIDNLGANMTGVNAVFNDSEGNLIIGDQSNNLYQVDKLDYSTTLIYTLTNTCDAIGGFTTRYDFIASEVCPEICDNGIDDDGDGDIDCDDDACPSALPVVRIDN